MVQLSQYLIGKVTDKNPKNKDGCTPLHFAAKNGNLELSRLIFKEAVENNPKTTVGITPHYLAAGNGHYEICKMFVTVPFN